MVFHATKPTLYLSLSPFGATSVLLDIAMWADRLVALSDPQTVSHF